MKKFDKDAKVLVRLSEKESDDLNVIIQDLHKNLESEGLRINFISRSQMVRTIVLNYIHEHNKKRGVKNENISI